jgi:6-pyruvoyl-tetrahydropterin synthase
VREINAHLEGADLNKLFGNPTTETLAVWIFDTIKKQFPQLSSVKVAEAADRWITYTGEN